MSKKISHRAITATLNENEHRGQTDWHSSLSLDNSGWYSPRAGIWLKLSEAIGLFMFYSTPEADRIWVSMSSFD